MEPASIIAIITAVGQALYSLVACFRGCTEVQEENNDPAPAKQHNEHQPNHHHYIMYPDGTFVEHYFQQQDNFTRGDEL